MSLKRRRAIPLAVFVGLALLAGPGRGNAGAPLLRDLAGEARLIVIGTVGEATSYAEGALILHAFSVHATVQGGDTSDSLRILEERGPLPAYEEGTRVLVFLERAPPHSFFREHLPPGSHYRALKGRTGVIELSPRQDDVARAIVAAADNDLSRDTRPLIRLELAAGNGRFAADAIAQLAALPDLADRFGEADLRAVSLCLRDARIGTPVKLDLMRVLGERDVRAALALLRAYRPASQRLALGRAAALAALGEPVRADEAMLQLSADDPQTRRLAALRLGESRSAENVSQLEKLALGDSDPKVRLAAIDALGRSRRPEAAPVLERTFQSKDPDERLASGRAIGKVGGEAARNALSNLILHGRDFDTQRYALILLLAQGHVTEDDPLLERIRAEHPDDRIREFLDTGIRAKHH